MLNLNKYTLSSTEDIKIISNETILEMSSDIDAAFIGVLTFPSGKTKTMQFVKWDNTYKCKIVLLENELKDLSTASIRVKAISDSGSKQSNALPILFDSKAIEMHYTKTYSKEIEILQSELTLLRNKVDNLVSKSSILTKLDIINPEDIKPGMMPVATGNEGKFMVQYPFADIITSVNKQKAVDGAVEIDSSMIKYKEDITIEGTLTNVTKAIVALNESILAITENQKQLASRLNELLIEFEKHKNTGIV